MNGVLTVTFDPDNTITNDLILEINGVGAPLAAQLLNAPPNTGLGTIPAAEIADIARKTAGATAPGEYATTGPITLADDKNDFEILATAEDTPGNDIGIVFLHTEGSGDVTAVWDDTVGVNGLLLVSFDPGAVSMKQVADAITDSAAPLEAVLLDETNDGSGTFDQGTLADGPAYITANGDYAQEASVKINPPGIDNAFEIYGDTPTPNLNKITIAFDEVTNRASIEWRPSPDNVDDRGTLSIRFIPGVTSVNTIIDLVNDLESCPLSARRIADPNTGGGILGEDAVLYDGAEFLIDATDEAPGVYERIFTNQTVDYATTGAIVPEGDQVAFQMMARDPGRNGTGSKSCSRATILLGTRPT